MREVLTEIWIENKWHPLVMAGKFALLFLLLFGGVILSGFPYSIIFFYLIFSLDIMLLMAPQVDFFLPRSREEWYQMKRKKCYLASIFYAGAAAGGYILNIAVTGRYHFDFIHMSAVWIMFSLFFLITLENRLHLEYIRYQEHYQEDLNALVEKEKNKLMASTLTTSVSVVMASILLILLCIVDFAEVPGLLFLQQKKFRIAELLIYIVLMGHSLYRAKCSQRKLKSLLLRQDGA